MTPEERFEELVAEYAGVPDIVPPGSGSGAGSGFGSHALRYRPQDLRDVGARAAGGQAAEGRVDELVGAAEGVRFDANKGTPMKEWLALAPESALAWRPLADEALAFAGAPASPSAS
jgi:hypothetical protein